jgi:hypothetical protein
VAAPVGSGRVTVSANIDGAPTLLVDGQTIDLTSGGALALAAGTVTEPVSTSANHVSGDNCGFWPETRLRRTETPGEFCPASAAEGHVETPAYSKKSR